MKNRLKVLRAEKDWTQADLADALDVSRQTINAIEKGKFDPSLPLAFKAARLFNLPIEKIFDENVKKTGRSNQNVKMKMYTDKALIILKEDNIYFDFIFINL